MIGKCHFKKLAETRKERDNLYLDLFLMINKNYCRKQCSGYIGTNFGCPYHVLNNRGVEKLIEAGDLEIRGVRK